MDDKIRLYKEVLELEPGSRVFFSLARLLYETGRVEECIQVLAKGVDFHPDHVEARMLLVEALQSQGRKDDMAPHVRSLNQKLTAYPGFLSAWSELVSGEMDDKDTALAISFLAARFHGTAVSWAEILERGLRGGLLASSSAENQKGEAGPSLGKPAPGKSAAREPAATKDSSSPRKASLGQESPRSPRRESVSLRTRTMADLLAEQGEYAGALDIYQELYEGAPQGQNKDELALIMEGIRSRMKDDGSASAPGNDGEDSGRKTGGEKKLLMEYLERLANRLEARAAKDSTAS